MPAGVHKTELVVHLDRLPIFCQQISQTIRAQTVGKAATFSKVSRVNQLFQVILGNVWYDEACRTLNVSMLSDRRVEQCKTLFKQITNQSLHRLLPAKRDAQLISRL